MLHLQTTGSSGPHGSPLFGLTKGLPFGTCPSSAECQIWGVVDVVCPVQMAALKNLGLNITKAKINKDQEPGKPVTHTFYLTDAKTSEKVRILLVSTQRPLPPRRSKCLWSKDLCMILLCTSSQEILSGFLNPLVL